MRNSKLTAIAVMFGCLMSGAVMAQAPVAPAATAVAADAKWSTDRLVGELLDHEAAKAVLLKHMPELVKDGQIEMVRGLAFRSLQQFSPDVLTDELLAKIDADLAKLPAGPAKPAQGK